MLLIVVYMSIEKLAKATLGRDRKKERTENILRFPFDYFH